MAGRFVRRCLAAGFVAAVVAGMAAATFEANSEKVVRGAAGTVKTTDTMSKPA